MKTTITLLLCAALACATVDPPRTRAQLAPAVFVLGCVIIGACIIIKISCSQPRPYAPVTLVLEKSGDGRATWVPIATNTVVLGTNTPHSVFSDQMTDDLAFYRVRVLKQ